MIHRPMTEAEYREVAVWAGHGPGWCTLAEILGWLAR